MESEAGKLAIAAYRYLVAARTIFEHTDRPRLMLAPILHLSAHGLEVLLKSTLALQGEGARELQNQFGHNILSMWTDPRCQLVREEALQWSETADAKAASVARLRGPKTKAPREMLDRCVADISRLHSRQPHPLRYIPGDEMVPPPHLLIFSLEPVADAAMRNPKSLVPLER